MSALSIGLSALQVSQQLIDIVGQNIANANTTGYHRQVANLAPLLTGDAIGDGVTITGVARQRSDLLETALLQNTVESQDTSAQLSTLQAVEAALAPGTGSIDQQLSNFFAQVQQLTTQPADVAQRQVVLEAAGSLADTFSTAGNELQQARQTLDSQAAALVGNINTYTQQIAGLNRQIQQATAVGQTPNDLLDQRDQLIGQLGQLVDVRVITTNLNEVNVIAGGAPLVVGTQSLPLQFQVNGSGQASFVRADGSNQALTPTGGQAAGILQVRNGDLPDLGGRLDTLAQQLIGSVNEIQATGLGLNGPQASAVGTREVNDPTVPLAQAGLGLPAEQTSLYISVTYTDPTTGAQSRTVTPVAVNTATDSLNKVAQDITSALNPPGGVTASVDPASHTLSITAQQPGYAIDFAGRLPSSPAVSFANGSTAVPQVGGTYTGTANDTYTFTVVVPPGAPLPATVGVTPGLSLQVTDTAGDSFPPINIGQGYAPGTALPAVNGVVAKLGAGTVSNGDSFQTPVIANPDSGNILSALGINAFFTGSSASTIAVNPALLSNPNQLAGSASGDPGDASNLVKLAQVQNAPALNNGTQTLAQYYAQIVGDVGARVQNLTQQQTAQKALGQQLQAQQQAVSGVDPNEELINLLQYQQSYAMAGKYISVVNDTLATLLQLVPATPGG
jgi:flagellar hook-associated protein 1 FlgK